MTNITIDELITTLQKAKKLIGGDKEVTLWRDADNHYTLNQQSIRQHDIDSIIYCDHTGISFEIDRVETD